MPVTINQLLPANAALPGYAVAQVLAIQSINQFAAVRGAGVGIGPASCCAAFGVMPTPDFPQIGAPPPFAVTFGNSRVAAGGLDNGPLGGHAERCAITAAGNNGLAPIVPAVLFVELAPCAHCATWLAGGGGGVANPYNFGPAGATLHVWFAFPYPAGVPAMEAFHNSPLPVQLAAAAAW